MIKAKFVIEAEVAFYEYPTKKLNRKAIVAIKQYIKETLNDELSYMPISEEEDEDGDGDYVTCCTRWSKFKIKEVN